MIGIGAMLCFVPSCKKSDIKPQKVDETYGTQLQKPGNASLYVMLESKSCATPQKEFTSATVDIRGIKVFNPAFGWEELTAVSNAVDVIALQNGPVTMTKLSETSTIHSGAITKIALTIGDNNKLVVNNKPIRCYNISKRDVVIDLKGEIDAGSANKLVLSIDVCGNITVQSKYDQEPCYTLNPVMAFENINIIMPVDPTAKN